MRYFVIVFVCILLVASSYAGTVTGKVTAQATGEPLTGANVFIEGQPIGDATDEDGTYSFEIKDGSYTLICDYVGYARQTQSINVSGTTTQDFVMYEFLFAKTIEVVADRARERETPVAFSNVEKKRIEANLGSRDIPLVLNTTPSVYATQQGGGAGDARVNVRGFNQRNVAIMINGMPVNDMENGWVYWSNWDGLGDATSSIQVQRGLSAVNLATPSIGGTMNIITDPTTQSAGLKLKQEFGNDGFLKTTFSGNTGVIDDSYALSATVVRKVGDGLIDKTWTDAWAYYFGASYNINETNRLELYALGAPQRHGQNSYKQNIGAFNQSFAKDLDDYESAALEDYPEAASGLKYNENWNKINSSYKGKQYWNGDTHDRFDPSFLNERENYFHKPLANLNWYSQLSNKLSLYSIAYWSGGHGGGTGTLGSLVWDYSGPSRIANWDATIARNDTNATGSRGILRNSVNRQWTFGFISKAYWKASEELHTTFGVDWRTAEIDHYREVRDLLGGDYFLDDASEFWSDSEQRRALGDKVDYNFTNTVDWFGVFGQGEYTSGQITAYGMLGYSMIKYTYVNHFRRASAGSSEELTAETDWINGFQIKGGASYRVTYAVDLFANLGYVSKVPIFDAVIDDYDATKATDPENEKFISVEGGVNFRALEGKLSAKTNFYFTEWKDRTNSRGVQINEQGDEGLIFFTGMNQRHMGVEIEAAFQPVTVFRLDAAASIGNWKYLDDVSGIVKDYSQPENRVTLNYYVKDLYVGDAPQTQVALGASVFPVPGMQAQVVYKNYMNHYSDWDPFSRDDPDDDAQPWKTPSYGVMDLHASYTLPLNWNRIGIQIFAHVFNLLDAEYIQDSVDNSAYNGFDDDHDADDAEVYFGLPRFLNVGITLTY